MFKKVLIALIAVFVLMSAARAVDSSNWNTTTVGYETFKIPPQYNNPYISDFDMYEFDENIDVFTLRYVNPNLMSLYGYFISQYHAKRSMYQDMMQFTSHTMTDMTGQTIQFYGFQQEMNSIISTGLDII